jgi:microcin C transport system substrate-binding protein
MDFEWMNRQLFYGIYKRLNSYFTNSDYEAKGLPGADERALLDPLKAELPPEVFTQPVPQPPVTTPPHSLRGNLRQARDLLAPAGGTYRDGALRNAHGQAFTIEFLDNSPSLGKVLTPFMRNLEKLGIASTYRVVDYAVYEKRVKRFDYEMMSLALPGQEVPGAELRQYYHSSLANVDGSDNLTGLANPAVDALIDRVAAAQTRQQLVVALRALDRVLRFGHYWVPHWYSNTFRVAWRGGRFAQPDILPPHYRPEAWALSCWWRK